jgi:ADP-ribosylation factor-like protein 8
MGQFFSWIQSLFWNQEMEIAVLGLAGAGKSSFVNAITSGNFEENVMPTVGFQMSKVQKGKVTIKVWDMGGQKKFRGMWERYCRGVEVIVFVVDANEQKSFQLAKKELKALLQKPTLNGIPLLTLLNKNDLKTAVQPELIIKDLYVSVWLRSLYLLRQLLFFRVVCLCNSVCVCISIVI